MSSVFNLFPLVLIPIIMHLPGKNECRDSSSQKQKAIFSFGIFTDAHYCDCDPSGTRYFRQSAGRLREALEKFRSDSVKFVVNLGDVIDHDYSSYQKVLEIIDSSGMKVYNITGNHDYSVDPALKNHLPLPQPSGEGYYSFMIGNFRFIALNGNELSTYAGSDEKVILEAADYIRTLKDSGSLNAIDWNGGISLKQMEWLKRQLDEAMANNEKVFILCHFPFFPEDIHNLLNFREVITILGNYHNIVACFAGHNHSGGYGNFNLIHFVTLRAMVETGDMNSFARIDVYPNKIWIAGYGREKSQILAY
jgi:manganese-dependent ADP-ribose/CDP-alcohol diphosphatase